MRFSQSFSLLLSLAAGFAAGCGDDPKCPAGRVKQGDSCVPPEYSGDGAMPATIITTDASSPGAPSLGSMDASVPTLDAGPTHDATSLPAADGGETAPDAPDAFVPTQPVSCLADADSDGYGVEAAMSCVPDVQPGDCDDSDATRNPGALDSCGDQQDNDCDGMVDEGVAEACNGQDDDCDGVADNGFECVAGATESACTTSCGTTGKGTCSSMCAPAAASACMPPSETCNWVDDDCDGIADPEMVTLFASAPARVYTQPLSTLEQSSSGRAATALLPNPSGGAYWLYRFEAEQPGEIQIFRLDAQGQVSGSRIDSSRTADSGSFVAAIDGRWVVIASEHRPLGRGVALRVQLFRSDDLRFVSEVELASLPHSDCGTYRPARLAVIEGAEDSVHVAAIYRGPAPNATSSSCGEQQLSFAVATRANNGSWGAPNRRALASSLTNHQVALVRSPCTSTGWYLAENTQVTRYTLGGNLDKEGLATLPDVSSIELATAACSDGNSELAIAYVTSAGLRPYLVRSPISSETFTPGPSRELSAASTQAVKLTHSRGRWFVLSYRFPASELSLLEVAQDAVDPRNVWTAGHDDAALPVGPLVYRLVTDQHALSVADVGEAIVVGVSVGENGNLDSLRQSGDSNPAVAATMRFGCQP